MSAAVEGSSLLSHPGNEQPVDFGGVGTTTNAPNWPPFKPLIYHDIDKDTKPQWRTVVTRHHLTTYGVAIALLWKLLTTIVSMFIGPASIWSLLGCLIVTPLFGSFAVWVYLILYKGTSSSSSSFSLKYGLFLAVFGLQIIIEFCFATGLIFGGGAWYLISSFAGGHFVSGIMYLLDTAAWGCLCAVHAAIFMAIRSTHSNIKSGGPNSSYIEQQQPSYTQAQQAPDLTAYDTEGFYDVESPAYGANPQTYGEPPASSDFDFTSDVSRMATNAAIHTAEEHKEELVQAAWDNKEAVAQAAYDNREVIAEHGSAIASAAYENRDLISGVVFGGQE